MQAIDCEFCGYRFPDHLGRYGCPNCHGEGIEINTPKLVDGHITVCNITPMPALRRETKMEKQVKFYLFVDGTKIRSEQEPYTPNDATQLYVVGSRWIKTRQTWAKSQCAWPLALLTQVAE